MKKIFEKLKTEVKKDVLMNNKTIPLQEALYIGAKAIQEKVKGGDGAGLSGGVLIDNYVGDMLTEYSDAIKPFHLGEADFCIDDEKVSFKKLDGAGGLALDWSKNPKDIGRERFVHPIIILQLDNSKWWKTNPKGNLKEGIKYKNQLAIKHIFP